MPRLFGKDIAGEIGRKLGEHLLPAVLHKITPGERMPGMLASGTNATVTTHTCRGFTAALEQRHVDGDLVKRTDTMVVLLGATIAGGAIPAAGDRVEIEGKTRAVVAVVDRDPAAATHALAAGRDHTVVLVHRSANDRQTVTFLAARRANYPCFT